MNTVKTENKKYTCMECQNVNEINDDKNIGDVVECSFCGIEYEVLEKDENGNLLMQVMEEEK